MTVSFFAGILPLIPFLIAIIIGGDTGASISNFLYKDFYPWVIMVGSVAILVGLVAMYVGKVESLSVKKSKKKEKKADNDQEEKK
jgi:uncharacterized integral membrane protein